MLHNRDLEFGELKKHIRVTMALSQELLAQLLCRQMVLRGILMLADGCRKMPIGMSGPSVKQDAPFLTSYLFVLPVFSPVVDGSTSA